MVGAGFSAGEADRLRRAMAAWRKSGAIDGFHKKIVSGMLKNGYTREFAEQCFLQIRGFGEYGFPESHAASFALLVYVSAWIKRYHPAAFCAALLNSPPMGFYARAQIVRDAREQGVEVRPVDVNASEWDCTLEPTEVTTEHTENTEGTEKKNKKRILSVYSVSSVPSVVNPSAPPAKDWGRYGPAVRLGFRQVKGLRQAHAERIVAARRRCGRFASLTQLRQRT